MTYRIAYDLEPENPNPHPWTLASDRFPTFEEAESAAEEDDRQQVEVEGYSREELPRWTILMEGGR